MPNHKIKAHTFGQAVSYYKLLLLKICIFKSGRMHFVSIKLFRFLVILNFDNVQSKGLGELRRFGAAIPSRRSVTVNEDISEFGWMATGWG